MKASSLAPCGKYRYGVLLNGDHPDGGGFFYSEKDQALADLEKILERWPNAEYCEWPNVPSLKWRPYVPPPRKCFYCAHPDGPCPREAQRGGLARF